MTRLTLLFVLAVSACDSPNDAGGKVGQVCQKAGFVCDTPTCSQFPENDACGYVMPKNAFCPIERPHCFDPSKAPGYCDPAIAICAKAKMGVACPMSLCSVDAVKVCYDTVDRLFCPRDHRCLQFACTDGGMGGDGGGGDGGDDGGADDMAAAADGGAGDMGAPPADGPRPG